MKTRQILAALMMLIATSLWADDNQFVGFDVNSEYNIWNRANARFDANMYPNCTQTDNGYTIHVSKATTTNWCEEYSERVVLVELNTDLTSNVLIPGEKYDLSVRVRISKPVETFQIKLNPNDPYGNSVPHLCPNYYLGTDTETEYVLFDTEIAVGYYAGFYSLTFGATTMVDDVDITISDIVLMNHNDNHTEVPDVKWKDHSPFTIENMEFEVVRFSLCTAQLNKMNEPYRDLTIPKTIHHFDTDFSIVSIGSEALSNQHELRSLALPASIHRIESYAMKGCKGICDIHIQNPEPPEAVSVSFGDIDREQSIIYVPVGSKDAYASAPGWCEFKRIVVEDATAPDDKICDAPEIHYADGALHFYSSTPGAQFHYNIEADDATSSTLICDGLLPLRGTYQINAFAHAVGYNVSPTVCVTLCWIDADPNLSMPIMADAKPALIKSVGNTIMIEGADRLSEIEFYAPDGHYLGSEPVVAGRTNFTTTEPLVLIKMGKQTVKVKNGMQN